MSARENGRPREPFQPTLPARGATPREICEPVPVPISTHAPRTGSDHLRGQAGAGSLHFNPRSPHGERPNQPGHDARHTGHFNPRSPHGERPRYHLLNLHSVFQFQPTLPARGATMAARSSALGTMDFNPRSPHGERPAGSSSFRRASLNFNPRSPHGERREAMDYVEYLTAFQPTLPARGATRQHRADCDLWAISTHAPRTGSDQRMRCAKPSARDFNPRSPHGERHPAGVKYWLSPSISTHAPRTGSDTSRCHVCEATKEFQPTLPARGATHGTEPAASAAADISTHAPRTGSDRCAMSVKIVSLLFQPTLPARGATPTRR